MNEDAKYIQKVLKGEKDAFRPVMKKYTKRLMAYVRNMLFVTHEDCQDIVASVFAKAYFKIHLYNPAFAFSTWIYRIAHNECVDFLRKNKKISWVQLQDTIPAKDVLYEIEGREVIQSILANVSEYERSILQMHFADQMKYEEIGSVVSKSPGTIAVHVLRAKKKLLAFI